MSLYAYFHPIFVWDKKKVASAKGVDETSQALLSQREPGVRQGPPPCYPASMTETTQPQRKVSQSVGHSSPEHQQQAVQVSVVVNKARTNLAADIYRACVLRLLLPEHHKLLQSALPRHLFTPPQTFFFQYLELHSQKSSPRMLLWYTTSYTTVLDNKK